MPHCSIGYLTWEWFPDIALRSPLYPLLFAVPFKILSFLSLDNRILLIKTPMFIHGILAAIGDYHLYMFSFQRAGQQVAQWTLFNQLVNWFTLYSCTRTLANNVEWVIVTVALHEYQSLQNTTLKQPVSRKLLLLTGVCGILRPTGLVLLLPMCAHLIVQQLRAATNVRNTLLATLRNCLIVGVFTASVSLLADRHFYGRWTCSQLNFLHFNLLTDVSHNYGLQPWHWYISNALPAMLLTQTVMLIVACWSEWKDVNSRYMIGLLCLVLHAYSWLGHKEFRFIFPVMPVAMHLIGCSFVRFPGKRKLIVTLLLVTQIPMAFYMSLIHQRGSNDVVMAIGRHIEHRSVNPVDLSVVFLMPCHSTPWSSHIHHNISARFLTCDPQITGGISLLDDQLKPARSLRNYDEADRFYDDPRQWLLDEYSPISARPTLWVMFDQLRPNISSLLTEWNYRICGRFFHAHFPTHSRHSSRILVYCLGNYVL